MLCFSLCILAGRVCQQLWKVPISLPICNDSVNIYRFSAFFEFLHRFAQMFQCLETVHQIAMAEYCTDEVTSMIFGEDGTCTV